MSEITKEMMEEFWKEYEEHIKNNPLKKVEGEIDTGDYLIKDGIALDKIEKYTNPESNKIRVLFVLKESNESKTEDKKSKSIFDEDGWFGTYHKSRKKMITMMIKMYKYIVKDSSPIDSEDIYKFAFINISKRGNGGKVCSTNLEEVIEKDKTILRKQIEILQPEVVVIGGKGISMMVEKEFIRKANLRKQPLVIHLQHFSRMGYQSKANAKEQTFCKQCEAIFK